MESKSTVNGWVARDCDGKLMLYSNRPRRHRNEFEKYWVKDGGFEFVLDSSDFPNLDWDDEPIKVNITLSALNED